MEMELKKWVCGLFIRKKVSQPKYYFVEGHCKMTSKVGAILVNEPVSVFVEADLSERQHLSLADRMTGHVYLALFPSDKRKGFANAKFEFIYESIVLLN